MQISALKKLLQLISPSDSPEEKESLVETSEQSLTESEIPNEEMQDDEMQNAECGMQNDEITVTHTESNRSHLTSSVPRAAKTPAGVMTKGELAEIRALFKNLSDKEIQRLYKRVTKNI